MKLVGMDPSPSMTRVVAISWYQHWSSFYNRDRGGGGVFEIKRIGKLFKKSGSVPSSKRCY